LLAVISRLQSYVFPISFSGAKRGEKQRKNGGLTNGKGEKETEVSGTCRLYLKGDLCEWGE